MTTPQQSLQNLLGAWEAWSHHDAVTTAVHDAAGRGDQARAAALRTLLTDESPPSVLDAVTAAAELVRLLNDGWMRAVDAALAAGVSWTYIGTATGSSAHPARAAHEAGSWPKPRRSENTDDGPTDRWLNAAQVASRVGRHVSSVTRAASAGLLHGPRRGKPIPGSRWTFRPGSVDAWAQGLDGRAQRAVCGCDPAATVRRSGGAR